ncbi:MAG: hypothetical protein FH749_13995, partial [Firmicutes bacterium]|nr:hypothetical protein [Bacillota bacterium]
LLGLESTKKEALALQEEYLAGLDAGKTYSPWFGLEGQFYMNITEKLQWQHHPFLEYPVWEKGFRRIYTQKSYCYRPGHWLVLKLRDNKAGREVRDKVKATFPEERMGTNVPMPLESEMILKLRTVKYWLHCYSYWQIQADPKPNLLHGAYAAAEEILQHCPHLYIGDDVYIWEEMARYWEDLKELNNAARCLLNQAQLQPGKTEAWLNLGAMYYGASLYGPAAAAYLRGLRFDPDDCYIKHNLNNIIEDKFAVAKARVYFNQCLEEDPDPFNFLIAGDFHCLIGKYDAAARIYRKGARVADSGNRAKLRCLTELAEIYFAKNDYAQAEIAVDQALSVWPDDDVALELAVKLELANGNNVELKEYARRLVRVQPNSVVGQRALARCLLALGEAKEAKQHAMKVKKITQEMSS